MRRITKILILISALYPIQPAAAQNIAINTTGAVADNSSILDISSTSSGLLIPRMTAAQRSAIMGPATGLLIYQTDSIAGFWYYNGTIWTTFNSGSSGWLITGNAGTVASTNFIGTTDNIPLTFKVNGEFSGLIDNVNSLTHFGYQAGLTNTGINNCFFGREAGRSNTFGGGNAGFGHQALYSNTSGQYNVAIGYQSLYDNTSGSHNIGLGYLSLANNSMGTYNVGIGFRSLYTNVGGNHNVGIGEFALTSNLGGNYNVAAGTEALNFNAFGSYNVAIGFRSLYNNTYATHNTAIGTEALYAQSFSNANVPFDSRNVAIGTQALMSNQPTSTTNGVRNTAVGNSCLRSNTIGYYNTAIGNVALWLNTTGYANTACGVHALGENTTGFANAALGYDCLNNNVDGNNNTAIGVNAGSGNVSGSANVFIGSNSGPGFPSVTSNKLYIGTSGNSLIWGDFLAGRVGINQNYSNYTLEVNGNARFNGDLRGNRGPSGLGAGLYDRGNDNVVSMDWNGSSLTFYVDVTPVKTFIINHPVDLNKYLVHATMEGPENGVYYRGTAQLTDGKTTIQLPEYFDALTHDSSATIILTPKGKTPYLLSYDEFNEKTFIVYGNIPNGAFDWEIKANRQDVPDLFIEPDKNEVIVQGDGPYKYYSLKRSTFQFPITQSNK